MKFKARDVITHRTGVRTRTVESLFRSEHARAEMIKTGRIVLNRKC